jgi:hypothetical protein
MEEEKYVSQFFESDEHLRPCQILSLSPFVTEGSCLYLM